MGKKKILRSKIGRRELNPTDAYRKRQRQLEKKRNKSERQRIRQEANLKKNPQLLKDELLSTREQELLGKLDEKGKKRLIHLEELWEQIKEQMKVAYANSLEEKQADVQNQSYLDGFMRVGTSSDDSEDSDVAAGDVDTATAADAVPIRHTSFDRSAAAPPPRAPQQFCYPPTAVPSSDLSRLFVPAAAIPQSLGLQQNNLGLPIFLHGHAAEGHCTPSTSPLPVAVAPPRPHTVAASNHSAKIEKSPSDNNRALLFVPTRLRVQSKSAVNSDGFIPTMNTVSAYSTGVDRISKAPSRGPVPGVKVSAFAVPSIGAAPLLTAPNAASAPAVPSQRNLSRPEEIDKVFSAFLAEVGEEEHFGRE